MGSYNNFGWIMDSTIATGPVHFKISWNTCWKSSGMNSQQRNEGIDNAGRHEEKWDGAVSMTNNQSTDLLFEISQAGRRCHRLPACDVPNQDVNALLPAEAVSAAPPPLPELGEIDLIRHYLNLSKRHLSIDT